MFGDFRVDQLGAMGLLARNRIPLVRLHEPGISDHVGGKDSGKSALFALLDHLPHPGQRLLTLVYGRQSWVSTVTASLLPLWVLVV